MYIINYPSIIGRVQTGFDRAFQYLYFEIVAIVFVAFDSGLTTLEIYRRNQGGKR